MTVQKVKLSELINTKKKGKRTISISLHADAIDALCLIAEGKQRSLTSIVTDILVSGAEALNLEASISQPKETTCA
jgi:hypothetical protein